MAKNIPATYSECLEYLFNLERAGIKYDLTNIRSLMKCLGNPDRSFKTIHVAGTNGKGSVSSIIYSYLVESGIRSGLNTSPHIRDFRERIICGGRMISRRFIIEFVRKMYSDIEQIKPSFFEVTTAMAFDYFRHRKAEIAVVETGLGGRLDSTNVVDPVVSVITGISVDHVHYLGSTISGIAMEKAGIIKKNRPVVTGKLSDETKSVIFSRSVKMNSMFVDSWKSVRGKILKRSEEGILLSLDGFRDKLAFPEIGDFQLINIKTAFSALKIFCEQGNYVFDKDIFAEALKNVSANSMLHGRFELISREPGIVIDVSHNLEAIKNLKKNLRYFKYRNLIVILGMMHDKDYCSCIREIAGIDCRVILTRPKYSRAAEPEVMLNCVVKNRKKFTVFNDLKSAAASALDDLAEEDLLVVTGSFFLAGEFLELSRVKRLLKK